jgi:hypothetical protein
MGIRAVNPVDGFGLPGGERLGRIEAEDITEQSLTAGHFVDSGNRTGKTVGGVEESHFIQKVSFKMI